MPNAEDDSPLVVFTTLANESAAETFVENLISRRLVACGTILPARSIYTWKGRVEKESESFVVLKTRKGRWQDLQSAVTDSHPYDVPELLAFPATDALPDYVAWILHETEEDRGIS